MAMNITELRLIDVFTDWLTNGIFKALNELDVPWKTDLSSDILDLEYFGNHSGDKYISPLIQKLLVNDKLTDDKIVTLANILYAQNKYQWNKLYNIYKLEYKPIENYSMVETEQGDDTRTDNFTNTNQSTNTDQQWAFNSEDWNNVNKSDNSNNSTNQGTSTNENNRTLTRSGNIGVTTSQQMIESEIALWQWNFIDTLFNDVDKLLTLKIY